MASINYISDSIYSPFTLDDYMKPLEAYGRAYDRAEDTLVKVADKTNPFEYLRNLEDGSQAKEIYTKYADALDKANTNFLRNGFNASTLGEVEDLRLRFGKEIGMLAKADERLSQAQAVQDNLRAKDPTRMFSNYNLHIDQFLNGNTPNLYSISGDDIYKRGMQLGQSASARNYKSGEAGSALDNYYKIWKESQGVHPSDIDSFIGSAEIQSYIDQNLESMGVGQLSEEDQMRARQEFTSGLYNGIVYKEATDLKRNEAKAEERTLAMHGFRRTNNGLVYEKENDPDYVKRKALMEDKAGLNGGGNLTDEDRFLGGDSTTGAKNLWKRRGVTSKKELFVPTSDGSYTIMTLDGKSAYPPFYGEMYNKNSSSFDVKEGAGGYSESDSEPFDFDNLKGEAKAQLREYVRTLPLGVENADDSEIDEVIKLMDLREDSDTWLLGLGDNHYTLRIPGVDEEGKVVDTNKLNAFLTQLNQYRMGLTSGKEASDEVEDDDVTLPGEKVNQTKLESSRQEEFNKVKNFLEKYN